LRGKHERSFWRATLKEMSDWWTGFLAWTGKKSQRWYFYPKNRLKITKAHRKPLNIFVHSKEVVRECDTDEKTDGGKIYHALIATIHLHLENPGHQREKNILMASLLQMQQNKNFIKIAASWYDTYCLYENIDIWRRRMDL